MKIAFFEIEEWQKAVIKRALKGHTVTFFAESLSKKHLSKIKDVDVLVVFIYSRVGKDVIDKLPRLKLVATMSTGYDHVDVAYCAEKNITVCNVPTYGENTVAEHAFALLLALSRKIYPGIIRTHQEHRFDTDISLRGFDVKGKTLGLIGCGNIGKHVAQFAKGFDMKVLVYDIFKDEKLAKKLGFRYASLNQVLGKSDVISLHTPYTEKTHHIIDDNAMAKMKDGVILINTARGGLIDTHALVKGLQSGKIGAAGLDVLEGECEVKEEFSVLKDEFKQTCDMKIMLEDHLLMKMENVIITPHNAFNSTEALTRILETTLNNIQGFKKKKINVVRKV